MAKKKVLVFIDGPVPTASERALAEKLGTGMFRNAQQVRADDVCESCTHAAGAVPAQYRDKEGITVIEADEPAVAVEEAPAPVAKPKKHRK